MKRLLILPAALLLLSACSGGTGTGNAEAEQAKADSIAAVQEAAAKAEQARLDSLREDSIKKVDAFIAAIPSYNEIKKAAGDYAKLFKKKGFDISYGKGEESMDGPDTPTITVKTTIATLKIDEDHYCIFKEYHDFTEGTGWRLTIEGAPEKLSSIAKAAQGEVQKFQNENPDDWYASACFVRKSGNMLHYHTPVAGD